MVSADHARFQSLLDFLVESHFTVYKNITTKRLAQLLRERDPTVDVAQWITYAWDHSRQLERSSYKGIGTRFPIQYFYIRETTETSIADRVAHAIVLPPTKFRQYVSEGVPLGANMSDFCFSDYHVVALTWSFDHPLLKQKLDCRNYRVLQDIEDDIISLGLRPKATYRTPFLMQYFTMKQVRVRNESNSVLVYHDPARTSESRQEISGSRQSRASPSNTSDRSSSASSDSRGEPSGSEVEDEEDVDSGDSDTASAWETAETSANSCIDSATPSSPFSCTSLSSTDVSETITAASLSDDEVEAAGEAAGTVIGYQAAVRRFAGLGVSLEPLPPCAAVRSVNEILSVGFVDKPAPPLSARSHAGWAMKAVFRHCTVNPRVPGLTGLRLLETVSRENTKREAEVQRETEESGDSWDCDREFPHDSAVEQVLDNLPATNLVQLLEGLYSHREIIQAMYTFSHLQRGMEDAASAHHLFMIDLWQLRYPAEHIRDVERSGLLLTDEKGQLLEEYLAALTPQLSVYPNALRADALLAFHRNPTMTVAALCKLMDVLRPAYAAAGLCDVTPHGLIWPKWLDASWVTAFCTSSISRQKELITKSFLEAFQHRLRQERQMATRRIVGAIPIVASEVPW